MPDGLQTAQMNTLYTLHDAFCIKSAVVCHCPLTFPLYVSINAHTHTDQTHVRREQTTIWEQWPALSRGVKAQVRPPLQHAHTGRETTLRPSHRPPSPSPPTALSVRALLIQSAHIHMQMCRGHYKTGIITHTHTHSSIFHRR